MKYTLTLLYHNKPCGSMEFVTRAMAEWMFREFVRRFRGDGFNVTLFSGTLEPEPAPRPAPETSHAA